MIISVRDISKAYGERAVLRGVSFSIEEGERAAFAGVNGAGKTTLFRIISGAVSPDSGSVYIPKGASVSFLEQNAGFESELSIYEEMLRAFEDVASAEEKLRALEARMGGRSGADYDRLLSEYNEVLNFFEQNGGYEYESHARGVIVGLGLDGGRRIPELSGGQKTRVALAKALLNKPELLLLDEPTNHLDINAMNWLEGYLKTYPKTVLFISHDRYFIDGAATKTVELENGIARVYGGGYSFYIKHKTQDFGTAQKRFKDAEKDLARRAEAVRLLKSFNREKSVKRARNIEKKMEKEEKPERPREVDKISLAFVPVAESGKDVLSVSEVSKAYGGMKVLDGVSLEVKKDEKVALLGPNGVGKTTLLKIITGELEPDGGAVRLGTNVEIGIYEQERRNLDTRKTVMEYVHDKFPKMTDGEIRDTLAAFLFRGDDVYKPVSALSGGEKGRVCLAEIMLSGANFLILDEPTNDLDMFSREILENALMEYQGTILCVSHDRYFINKVAGRVLELTGSGIAGYLGDYDYYLHKKQEEREEAEEARWFAERQSGQTVKRERETERQAAAKPKNEWLERKAEAAEQRKRAAAIQTIEREIEETESEIAKCDERLCLPEVFSDHVKAREAHDLKLALEIELERLYAQWEEESAAK